MEVYDFTHEDNGPIAYTGYLPVHNGELLSRDDFTGLPVSTNDCLFRYDAEWICNVDGACAGVRVRVRVLVAGGGLSVRGHALALFEAGAHCPRIHPPETQLTT